MNDKIEVVKSYLKLLRIEFDFDNEKLVSVINKNANDFNYVGYYNEKMYNDKNIKVNINEECVNVTLKENMVIVHYNSEESSNYDLGFSALNYNWFTTYTDKIAYIFQDDNNIVITIGLDSKCSFKDNNGNIKSYVERPRTIQDMDVLEVLTVPISENIDFRKDISELVKPHLKIKEYSLYNKI